MTAETPRRTLALLFCVMLAIACGNTALQSVLPGIGRTLGVPDTVVAVTFSASALIWSVAASYWARQSGRSGRRRLIAIGLGGFVLSMVACAAALTAGLRGWVAPGLAFAGFIAGRTIYGGFGAAAPPAAQAMLAERTDEQDRTRVLTLLASGFGLGTIIGPALAPFFVLPFFGLAGPAVIFAGLATLVLLTVVRWLPDEGPATRRGAAQTEPSLSGQQSGASVIAAAAEREGAIEVRWRDPRVRGWLLVGIVAGHAQAMIGQTMAFLLIDRLALAPALAQPLVGTVLMAGAFATLLAQWGLIPLLSLTPHRLVRWGAATAAAGAAGIGLASGLHAIAVAYALTCLGFGLIRPGFTAGASLAVEQAEQASIAGRVTTVNGLVFVLGPSIGVALYQLGRPLPYWTASAGLAALLVVMAGRSRRAGSAFPG